MTRTNNHRSLRSFTAHSAARFLLLAMVALMFLSLATRAHAQQRTANASALKTTFGGEFAINYLLMSLDQVSLNGVGFHIAALADFPVNTTTGIIAKAGYESKHGTGTIAQSGLTLNESVTLNYFELSGMVRHNINETVVLHGGLAMQFDAGGSHGEVTISDGSASASDQRNGNLVVSTQFALVGGVGYRMALSPTMDLIPNATLNFGLTSPSSSGTSTAHTFRIGARLMFK